MSFILRLFSIVGLLFIFSCDTTPPSVSITSVTAGSTVNEIVTITVDADDNEGISKVEFYINDELIETDTEYPYEYVWNTTEYDNGTEHTLRVVAYDEMDNSALDEVSVTVDNSTAVPNGGNVVSVEYNLEEMTVVWEPSTNGDFQDYTVLHSATEDGDKESLATYTDISTTSHSITEFDPIVENWFYVQVSDTLGLTTMGTGMTNSLDNAPNAVNVTSVTYDTESMTITWEDYVPNLSRINQMNQNTRNSITNDFVSYELLQSDSEDGTYTSVVAITDQTTISYSLTEFDPTQENWFKVKITDYWGLSSTGTGMTNTVDSPPTASILDAIVYENGSFMITWSQSIDTDFGSYKLYESLSEDMSEAYLIHEYEMVAETSHVVDGITVGETLYYYVVTEDVFGLQTESQMEEGITYLFQANFTYDWGSTNDLGPGIIFLSRMDGSYLASATWEGDGSLYIPVPDGLSTIPDSFSVTTVVNRELTTNMNIPRGSSWTWGKNYPDIPDNYEGIPLIFNNVPDFDRGVISSTWRRSYNIADTMTVYVWGLPTDLYLGLNTLSSGFQYLFMDGISGEHVQDLSLLSNTSEVTINLNNSVPSRKYFYGYPNPGSRYSGRYTLDYENNIDTLVSSITFNYPASEFTDYRTSIYEYDEPNNFSNYWRQSVYGDIPTEFTKIDADFDYINTSPTEFQLAVSSQNFDNIRSAWIDTNYISNDGYTYWTIYGPSGNTEYSLPEIPELVIEQVQDIDRDLFLLNSVRIMDHTEISSYEDVIELIFKSPDLFYNVVNDIRYRQKGNPQSNLNRKQYGLGKQKQKLEEEHFPGDQMYLHYKNLRENRVR